MILRITQAQQQAGAGGRGRCHDRFLPLYTVESDRRYTASRESEVVPVLQLTAKFEFFPAMSTIWRCFPGQSSRFGLNVAICSPRVEMQESVEEVVASLS
jgi:hypothetical protein